MISNIRIQQRDGQGGVDVVKRSIIILLGSCFISFGINFFIIPNHLINGGIIGLGIIANYAFQFKPGLTIITLSLPLYFIAWFYFRTYFYNGLHGLLVSSFFIDLFQPLSKLIETPPILISSLIGGLFIGIGIGVMLLIKASTGGGDLLALMISNLTLINVGILIFMIDSLVILIGGIVVQDAQVFFSFLMVFMIGLTTYLMTTLFK